jgi:steroid 5-alpha reductase family enzyme
LSFGAWLCAAFIACWSVMLCADTAAFVRLVHVNTAAQLLLFAAVAVVPFLRTRRVSWVDIAWPFGVALIGAVILTLGAGWGPRRWLVGAAYLFIGLRMGIGAVTMARATGVIFEREFPRYRYRRLMLEEAGERHVDVHLLAEILAQGFANITVLALPGFLMALNPRPGFEAWEVAGMAVWACGYALESLADVQKLRFASQQRGSVCNVGLWRYSRHPNYFGEWLVWTGLVLAALPSWMGLRDVEPTGVWIALGIGALGASAMLYTTLVYLTGARPAEYFSARNRPGYREYQARTNMFFPWFPRAP